MSIIIYIFHIIDSLSNFTTKARTISSQTLGGEFLRIRSVHARASTEGLIYEIRPSSLSHNCFNLIPLFYFTPPRYIIT